MKQQVKLVNFLISRIHFEEIRESKSEFPVELEKKQDVDAVSWHVEELSCVFQDGTKATRETYWAVRKFRERSFKKQDMKFKEQLGQATDYGEKKGAHNHPVDMASRVRFDELLILVQLRSHFDHQNQIDHENEQQDEEIVDEVMSASRHCYPRRRVVVEPFHEIS